MSAPAACHRAAPPRGSGHPRVATKDLLRRERWSYDAGRGGAGTSSSPVLGVERLRGLLREDRGAATTEIVIILPLLFLLVLLIAQVTLWGHASHIAQATASHALAAARVEDGTAQAGRVEGEEILDQLGRGPLRGARISVTRGADRAAVEVEGSASSVVPFLHLPIHAQAAGPLEKFTPPGQAAP